MTASAQDWIRQTPFPADDHLNTIAFIDENVGIIGGDDDILMMTADGGETWRQVAAVPRDPLFYEDPYHDIEFLTPDIAVAIGNFHMHTADGGQTWHSILGAAGTLYELDFPTTQVGFASSRRAVWKTTDAGATWSEIVPDSLDHFITDVSFATSQVGIAVYEMNNQTGVFRTQNGGQTWSRIAPDQFEMVLMLDEDTVLATFLCRFYRSTDGGATWSLVMDANTERVNFVEELVRIDADSVAAIDQTARIWISRDRGQTWTLTQDWIGDWGVGWDLSFSTPDVGYATGRLGVIYKSVDGGQSWNQISNGAAVPVNDIMMLPSGLGLAVAEDHAILRTEDFGRRWVLDQPAANAGSDLLRIEHVGDDTFFIGGENGALYRSRDQGRSWTRIGPAEIFGGNCIVLDIEFIDEMNGWAFGEINWPGGFIAKTTDGGDTWELLLAHQRTTITAGEMFDLNNGRALQPTLGSGDLQLLTSDGFHTHEAQVLPSSSSQNWFALDYATPQVGWYASIYGGVLRTTDGGQTFTAQPLPGFGSGQVLMDLFTLDTQNAVIATTVAEQAIADGYIYRTTNGGTTWTRLNRIADPNHATAGVIWAVWMLPTGEIWTCGGNGYIYASALPSESQPAELTGLEILDGQLIAGGLPQLTASDDHHLEIEARVTGEVHQPHLLRLRITAETEVQSASQLTLTVEGRITDIEAQTTLLLRDWVNGGFVQVGQFSMSMSESVHEVAVPDAARFIRASDGRLVLEVKQIVFLPFTLSGFHTLFDQIEIAVR